MTPLLKKLNASNYFWKQEQEDMTRSKQQKEEQGLVVVCKKEERGKLQSVKD